MFDKITQQAIAEIAAAHNFDPAALMAVAETEAGGQPFAVVNGRKEPLIRFEGHYFDRRLDADDRARARKLGLSSPTAGAVKNPTKQADRWDLLGRASAINPEAALESVSWGLGQVMGAHWKWLGYPSVQDMVHSVRTNGIAGQVELMVRFIEKSGLAGALRARNWAVFAKGYNGPAYKKNAYDTKMRSAFARYADTAPIAETSDRTVTKLQQRLVKHGFAIDVDGIRGKQTDTALKAFQKAKGLKVDGIAGTETWKALMK